MLINVKVITNASKDQVVQKTKSEFLIKVTTAPEKGKANKRIIELLADYFRVSKSDISIAKGQTSPRKIIKIRQERIYV